MARPAASQILGALTSLVPRRRIRELARELGVVQRRRKLDVVALVYALALGFSVGDRRTLSGLRRAYLRVTGTRLAPSSFHARFSDSPTEVTPSPLLGEHTDEILKSIVGWSDAEIFAARKEGAV